MPRKPPSTASLRQGIHDKRATDKDRDWQRDKGRIMKAMRR